MRENENVIETLDYNLQSTSEPDEYIAMGGGVLFCKAPYGDKTMGDKLAKLLAHQFLVSHDGINEALWEDIYTVVAKM